MRARRSIPRLAGRLQKRHARAFCSFTWVARRVYEEGSSTKWNTCSRNALLQDARRLIKRNKLPRVQ